MLHIPPGSSVCLAAVPAPYIARPRNVEKGWEKEEGREVLEIYTSFRPETTTYITADKLEQVHTTALVTHHLQLYWEVLFRHCSPLRVKLGPKLLFILLDPKNHSIK